MEDGIRIQHDGAKPHGNEEMLRQAGLADGWNIKFVTQPAQSPDLNVMDLGLFNSLKHRVSQIKERALNIDMLIANVQAAYAQYDAHTLDKVWAHQVDCWNAILKVDGSNQYKPPHRGRQNRPQNAGTAVDLTIDIDEYNRVFVMINA